MRKFAYVHQTRPFSAQLDEGAKILQAHNGAVQHHSRHDLTPFERERFFHGQLDVILKHPLHPYRNIVAGLQNLFHCFNFSVGFGGVDDLGDMQKGWDRGLNIHQRALQRCL